MGFLTLEQNSCSTNLRLAFTLSVAPDRDQRTMFDTKNEFDGASLIMMLDRVQVRRWSMCLLLKRVVTLSAGRSRVWSLRHDSYENRVFLFYFAPLNTLVLEVDSVRNLHILNIYPNPTLSSLYTDVRIVSNVISSNIFLRMWSSPKCAEE